MKETMPTETCPMARACKGMAEKPGTRLWMVVPGLIFVALGITIVLYPQILVWLVAVALIVMGVAMMMMASFMRSFGERVHNKPV